MTGGGLQPIVDALLVASPVVIAFLVLTWLMWFLLPFAVFGIKSRLDRIIELQEQILRGKSSRSLPNIPAEEETPVERAMRYPRRDL